MAFRDFLPFQQAPAVQRAARGKRAQVVAPEDASVLAKVFKIAALAVGYQGGGSGRANFEISRYDFLRILEAIDTDSFVKMAFSKYRELMWKEGWHLVSENPDAIAYLHQRFDFLEMVMNRPFQDLLTDVADQLVKFHNAYLVKARGDISAFFPAPLQGIAKNGQTVVGYYLLPAETVEIARDKNNKPVRYRQNTQGAGGLPPEFAPEDVIHFSIDKKPGRAYGTPFMVANLDDIVSLRQVEEDILNLVHRELFPLYKYTVGTPEAPAEPDEIIQAQNELENLRTDGGLILPERHDVDVIGAGGHELNAEQYLKYFRQRVISGLGLAEHHMGITSEGGNRAVADRLDVALYDRIKMYQRYIEDMIRLRILNELLLEGGYDPMASPMDINATADRTTFRFKEIDVDTQVKKDNQVLQKFTAGATTLQETRRDLSGDDLPPDVDESQLSAAIAARMAPNSLTTSKRADGSTKPVSIDNTPPAAIAGGQPQSDKAAPSARGKTNTSNVARRQVGNKAQPANQHGKAMSPNIRRSADDDDLLAEIVELLDEDE